MPRRKRSSFALRLALLLLLLMGGIGSWFVWSLRPIAGEMHRITISEGMGADDIAQYLVQEGLVRSRAAFTIYTYFSGSRARLRAGNYTVTSGADVAEIIGILTGGGEAEERTVRIIEGWTIEEMDAYLATQGVFGKGMFTEATEKIMKECRRGEVAGRGFALARSCQVVEGIGKKAGTIEGYLFPDTYRLFADAKPEDLVEKMLLRFDEKTDDEQFQKMLRDSGYTLPDAVVMASIVEAEVPHAEDRAVVSGLLWKRVESGMPLQVDATVNYITGKHTPSASLEDLKINSPYNTYLYPDLPPGPIGSPGMDALTAAVSPEESPYWFYLSAQDGTTVFSKTFEEHVAAKERYLR